jgi:hypothetical protein
MSKRKVQVYLIMIAITAILVGCTNSPPVPSEADILTAMAETSAAVPTATLIPTVEPTYTPTPTITPTPDFVTRAIVTSSNLNLRTGPSKLFKILDTYTQGDEVFVIGQVPDGKWLLIEATRKDGSGRTASGWMYAEFLDLRNNINILPIIELPTNQTIKGTIKDNEGNPLNGIRVSAFYEPEGSAETFSDDTTGVDGEFVIYIPDNATGTLDVQIVAVNCDSIIMDDDCILRQYFPLTWRVIGRMPFIDSINFVYEKAITVLEGKVVYQDGWGKPNVWVRAVRQSDDAETKVFTEIGGRFIFPLGEGVWEVFAVRTDEDGKTYITDPEIYTITEESDQPEYLRILVK